ncbi:MAG: hypothetical protein ACOYOQ_14500, partial [Microthrixaceae bacterium]
MTDLLGPAAGPAAPALPPVRAAEGLRLGWIRRLWPVLAPQRRVVIASFLVGLVSLSISVAVPTIVGVT